MAQVSESEAIEEKERIEKVLKRESCVGIHLDVHVLGKVRLLSVENKNSLPKCLLIIQLELFDLVS